MKRIVLICLTAVTIFLVAHAKADAQEKECLRLVQTIPMPNVKGAHRSHGCGCEGEAALCGGT